MASCDIGNGFLKGSVSAARRSRAISKIYHSIRLRILSASGKEPIIIYQMGKVGSTAVMRSLNAQHFWLPVFHVHYLSDEGIANARHRLHKQQLNGDTGNRNVNRWGLYESDYLRAELQRFKRTYGRLRLVTLVRDPVSRTVSSFFYGLDDYAQNVGSDLNALGKLFLEKFPGHDFPLKWFNREFRAFTGIDIFDQDFDKERGYETYRTEDLEVLVVKLEKANDCLPQALEGSFRISGVELVRANAAADFTYYDVYRQFLQHFELPSSYLDEMYTSKLSKHFYSDRELQQFRDKWQMQL